MLFLWVFRDEFGIIGFKYGCGIIVCGVCIVYIDGMVIRLCLMLVGDVFGEVIIIEGFGIFDVFYVV